MSLVAVKENQAKDMKMKQNGSLAMGMLTGLLIIFISGSGLSFVTPEHYEKIKQEARAKEKPAEKSEREVPGKIQVHLPADSKSAPDGAKTR
jgi:hypothetical protein